MQDPEKGLLYNYLGTNPRLADKRCIGERRVRMYKFRFGNLFALLDEIKIKRNEKLGSQVKLYAALLNPFQVKDFPVDAGNVGKLVSGKFAPSGHANGIVNSLTVDQLAQSYELNVIPNLNQGKLGALVLAVREILKRDEGVAANQKFALEECTKQKVLSDNVVYLARLLACLVKHLANQPNAKIKSEEPLPKGFVASFAESAEARDIKIVHGEEEVLTSFEKTISTSNFSEVFEEVNPSTYSLDISNTNRFKVYILDIYKKAFDTAKIEEFIIDNLGGYLRSRVELKESAESGRLSGLGIRAAKEMKAQTSDMAEAFSQIMMYSFMESVLHAPKIYSAYEISQSPQRPNAHISGVYLLPYGSVESGANQLVFGSSNVRNSITDAIDTVLGIASDIDREHTAIKSHIDSSIFRRGEGFSDKAKEYLKKILVPNKNDSIETINSFCIFFSYSIDTSRIGTSNIHEVKGAIEAEIDSDIRKAIPYIEKKIRGLKLDDYPFYFFVLPLTQAEGTSAYIMERVLG